MTPRDFIDELKAQHPVAPIGEDALPDSIRAIAKKTGRDPGALAKMFNKQDYAEYLLEVLLPRVPAGVQRLFESGWLAAGAIANPAPEAYLKALDSSGYAIIFHTGLKDLIYRVARILATRFTPSGPADISPEVPGIEQTARLIAEVFWWLQETGRAFGPGYPITDQQITIASLLAQEAGAFLLAHEIGHAIADCSDIEAAGLGIAVDEFMPLEHRDEHVADVIGLCLTMGIGNPQVKPHPFRTPLAYAGAELALQIYQALAILEFEFNETHPPAGKRIAHLRATMQSKCASEEAWQAVSSLALGIDGMLAQMIGIIQKPGEHAAFFEQEAQQIASEFDALLTRCVGGVVPDYAIFYMEADSVLSRGYSHRMIERVAAIAGDWFKSMRSPMQSPEDIRGHQLRLQKFKLLLGFVTQHLNEPARSQFLNALELSAPSG